MIVTLPVTQSEIALWLAEQTIASSATARLTRQLTKLGLRRTAAALGPVALGAELAYAAARYGASKGTSPSPNLYSKEIALYEQSALRSSRLI